MGLFRCKHCDKVFTSAFQSVKPGLCQECYRKLEDMYSHSKIHDYIRDHGLQRDFDPEELAHEVGVSPRNIKILYDFGFFDRDIQTYNTSSNRERKKLAEEFRHEIEKINNVKKIEREEPPRQNYNHRTKFVTYGGGLYRRKK